MHEKHLRRKCNRDWKVSIDSRNAFCKHRYGVWIRIPNAIEIVRQARAKMEYRVSIANVLCLEKNWRKENRISLCNVF